jgi:transposase
MIGRRRALEKGTTLLLGLPGVAVSHVERRDDGTRVVHLVTAGEYAGLCPRCGIVSTSHKEAVVTGPRDIPYGTDGLKLVWHKHRWRCRNIGCPLQTFTESIPQVLPRRRTTGRLRSAVAHAVACNRSVAEVAAENGVGWSTVQACVDEHTDQVLTEPAPTPVLGIDETRRGKPQWRLDPLTRRWVLVDRWDTGFVDLHGGQGLLGQAEGRTSATVTGWLALRSQAFREAIRYVVIDPAASYRAAITPDLLPKAQLVVDHFHLVRLANDTVTTVRRRVTWELRNRRDRKVDPEWANRRRLLTGRERLRPKAFAAMWNELLTHDPTGQILAAWIAKEELRTLLASARQQAAPHVIRARLHDFYAWCASTDIPEVHKLAGTIEAWWPQTLLFLHTGLTNARTEGINRVVKSVGRRACGFRNPHNHRRRVRLVCNHRRASAINRHTPC